MAQSKSQLTATGKAELDTIGKIADRAVALYDQHNVKVERINVLMDVMATHKHAQRLRLDDLLAADDFNFMHDIAGINKHLDRDTYELADFSPRFSERRAA